MSPPSMESAAFENSITAREAAPTAVETRSEFRYRFEAAAPQKMARQRLGPGERARRSPVEFCIFYSTGLGCTSTRPRGLS
jgi:hypothetical protein